MSNGRPPNQGIGVSWSASREPTKYGLWARLRRQAAGLTQQALAVKTGLSVSAVGRFEAGRFPDPRASTLKALAKALGVTLDALVSDEDEPSAAAGPKNWWAAPSRQP
jgi:transcriptional regulator with XRE-family HTH domain